VAKGEGPREFRVDYGGEELLVISVPLREGPPDALTSAQLAVVRAIVRGASNVDIARERGTSVRTVANQVASILRKLGVGSRAQVAATLANVDLQPAPPKVTDSESV
jgi:DNA-binding NarL/FixJ family response regulator